MPLPPAAVILEHQPVTSVVSEMEHIIVLDWLVLMERYFPFF